MLISTGPRVFIYHNGIKAELFKWECEALRILTLQIVVFFFLEELLPDSDRSLSALCLVLQILGRLVCGVDGGRGRELAAQPQLAIDQPRLGHSSDLCQFQPAGFYMNLTRH